MVRLLLAWLPLHVTIAIYYSTDEWVHQTYRVHVPVLVRKPENVLFRCRVSEDSMKSIDCNKKHVFGMENQAKHTILNCSNNYRVHLILDYIDVEFENNKTYTVECG